MYTYFLGFTLKLKTIFNLIVSIWYHVSLFYVFVTEFIQPTYRLLFKLDIKCKFLGKVQIKQRDTYMDKLKGWDFIDIGRIYTASVGLTLD